MMAVFHFFNSVKEFKKQKKTKKKNFNYLAICFKEEIKLVLVSLVIVLFMMTQNGCGHNHIIL